MSYIRPEARVSVENFALKADPIPKRRFYRFFGDGPEGGSRGSDSGAAGGGGKISLSALEEAEKELELQNWRSSYTSTNNQLGDTLKHVQQRAQGDKVGVLQVCHHLPHIWSP